MAINIGILDDHQIVIQGLKMLLENEKQFNVLVESNNGFAFIEKIQELAVPPDVVLVDLMMPVISGYESALLLKERFPGLKILILSMNNEIKTIHSLIEKADIRGFVSKAVDKKDFVTAIEMVHAGSLYFTDDVLNELYKFSSKKEEKEKIRLSAREIEIIRLVSEGLTSKEIGARIFISELTAATHRKNIFRKTGTRNAASLVEFAKRLGIID